MCEEVESIACGDVIKDRLHGVPECGLGATFEASQVLFDFAKGRFDGAEVW